MRFGCLHYNNPWDKYSVAELYQAGNHVARKMMQFVGLLHTCPPLGRIQAAGEPNGTAGYKDKEPIPLLDT